MHYGLGNWHDICKFPSISPTIRNITDNRYYMCKGPLPVAAFTRDKNSLHGPLLQRDTVYSSAPNTQSCGPPPIYTCFLPLWAIYRIDAQVFVTQVHLTRSLVTGTSTKQPYRPVYLRVSSSFSGPGYKMDRCHATTTYAHTRLVCLFPSRPSSFVSLSVFKEASRGVRAGMHKIRDGTTEESTFEAT